MLIEHTTLEQIKFSFAAEKAISSENETLSVFLVRSSTSDVFTVKSLLSESLFFDPLLVWERSCLALSSTFLKQRK